MTEIETLREAARLMRERAEAATSGRWVDEYSSEAGNCVIPDDAQSTREHVARTQLFCAVYDAKHIAGMDPAVALAVADWLEDTAATPGLEIWSKGDRGHLRKLIHAALAVARTYLREAS